MSGVHPKFRLKFKPCLFVSNRIQYVPIYTLVQSSVFEAWLSALDDRKAKARILARLKSAMFGHWGDCKPVGEGISEMRVHVGAGYRVYYMRIGNTVYVLLTGGNKSTQKKDITRAKTMARELKEGKR